MRLTDNAQEPTMAGGINAQALEARPSAGTEGDPYAVWRDVFAKAKPLAEGADTPSSVGDRSAPAEGSDERGAPSRHRDAAAASRQATGTGAFRSVTADRARSASEAAPASPPAADRRSLTEAAMAPAGAEPTDRQQGSPVLQRRGASARLPCDEAAARPSAGSPTGRGAPAASDAAALPTDSVLVFRRGGSVAITVRDHALLPEVAVRCALETARQLTGEPCSLCHVTLNGKTVYERALGPEEDVARHTRRLVFAC